MRQELEAALALARSLPPEDLPALIGALAEVTATAQSRLASPPVEARPDQLLDVNEAAARLHCSPGYLYRHHRKLPFTRPGRIGGKLLFSSSALDLYLKKSR
jgi:excisionase family DNA binding protein